MSALPIPPIPTLADARVSLRALRASDADDLFALQSDPRVMRYWSHPPWTDRAQAIERIAQLERDRTVSEFYPWAITHAGADRLIGTVSLFAVNHAQFRGEIGYSLVAAEWGRGYATGALRLAIAFAFGTLGLKRLEADIDPRNTASCKLVERVGFVREGFLRERWHVAGEVTDSVIYGLLAREYVD
jgi:ribosomal-protein-alanine N-acetyltransferase